jgi:hypothetical protein
VHIRFFIIALSTLVGCSISHYKKRLSDTEQTHYRALEVYLDQPDASGERPTDERLAFLKLKTEDERNAWLKSFKLPSSGGEGTLWEKFYKYEPHIRELIDRGEVQEGWTLDMVYMSWGRPMKREKPPACNASRCWRYIYRFEQLDDGTVQVWVDGSKDEYRAVSIYDREVEVGDNKVLSIKTKKVR